MGRAYTGRHVFDAAYERLSLLYKGGHRLVVSFSGGKDSTVCLELAILAARDAGRLPVEVILQDEEIAYPGTYEFIERTAKRPEVSMNWMVLRQPMLNIFNRAAPYWWVCDPLLDPEEWVRQPPPCAKFDPDKAIELMTNPLRFPVAYSPPRTTFDWDDGRQCLFAVIGLRTAESAKRLMGLHASGSYLTGSNDLGVFNCRPIYDWGDGDVWKFIRDIKCDYNPAYDVMYKMGIAKKNLRIGPPTLNVHSLDALAIASRAWPAWFDKVCKRLNGVRTATQFGRRVCQPHRRYGETWEQCYMRECVGPDAPEWIRERATTVMIRKLSAHAHHSTAPFPENTPCMGCGVNGSWHAMANNMWGGDPYCLKTAGVLEMIEPEFFRPGSGTWAGDWAKILGKKHIKVLF